MSAEKVSWKKNLDSTYISGEDLQSELKGLKKEMIVVIEKFNDAEIFDQNKSKKVILSALYLKEIGGASLYKPVVLNRTNARFFDKEMGTEFMNEWIGKPVVLFAQKDSRHGWVARFRSYIKPELIDGSENFIKCKTAIEKNGYTIDQIRDRFKVSSEVEKKLLSK